MDRTREFDGLTVYRNSPTSCRVDGRGRTSTENRIAYVDLIGSLMCQRVPRKPRIRNHSRSKEREREEKGEREEEGEREREGKGEVEGKWDKKRKREREKTDDIV